MDWAAAFWAVVSRAPRVRAVLERVCDWETPRRRVCGILGVGGVWMRGCGGAVLSRRVVELIEKRTA